MHHEHHVVDGGFQCDRRGRFGENFRRQRADDVHAQNLAVFFFGHHFDETFVLAEDGGLAVAEEREFADLHLVARLARLPFGQPDRADLRLAIGAVGNARALERAALLCRPFFRPR